MQRCSTKIFFFLLPLLSPFWYSCWMLHTAGHSTGKQSAVQRTSCPHKRLDKPGPSVSQFCVQRTCQVSLVVVTWRKFGAFPLSEVWCSLRSLMFFLPHSHSPCSSIYYCPALLLLDQALNGGGSLTILPPCSPGRPGVVYGLDLFTQLQCEDYSVKVLRASWAKTGVQLLLQGPLLLMFFERKEVGFFFFFFSL